MHKNGNFVRSGYPNLVLFKNRQPASPPQLYTLGTAEHPLVLAEWSYDEPCPACHSCHVDEVEVAADGEARGIKYKCLVCPTESETFYS